MGGHLPALMGSAIVEPEAWIVTLTIGDDLTGAVPICLYGQDDGITITIDWGDGTSSTVTTDDYSSAVDMDASIHTYEAEGTYTVTMSSTKWSKVYLESCYSTSTGSNSRYTALHAWQSTLTAVNSPIPAVAGGEMYTSWTGTTSYSYLAPFCNCSALASIPADLFSNCGGIDCFDYCFYGCASLATLPDGLFDACSPKTYFRRVFYGCTSLTSLPDGLLDTCSSVIHFSYAFRDCTSLTSLPAGLFDNCTAATNFESIFRNCTSLLTIPEGLFDNCTAVENFGAAFYGCTKLGSVPEHLFLYNAAITDTASVFYKCSSLTPTVYVGSENVVSAGYFAYATAATGTVYVPADSTTYETFSSATNANVNIETF